MRLLCDEDVGTGVPRALYSVGYDARALIDLGWRGFPDIRWLTLAAQNDWLVLSCNKKMLLVPEERDTINRERLGIVYLTHGEEHPPQVLGLLLKKWGDLELLDNTQQRPFAWFLSPRGGLTQTYRHFKL